MIVSGGENADPAQVEYALVTHPDVIKGALIGIPDAHWRKCVRATVYLRAGSLATKTVLIQHCVPLIANYKGPKSIGPRYLPLPMSAVGKILKTRLRAPFWQGRNQLIG